MILLRRLRHIVAVPTVQTFIPGQEMYYQCFGLEDQGIEVTKVAFSKACMPARFTAQLPLLDLSYDSSAGLQP